MKYLLTPLFIILTGILALTIVSCSRPSIINLSVDISRQYQVIEGFGGFGAKKVWWDKPPFFDSAYIDLLTEDLGISVIRDNIPLSFEPENDNSDALLTDWSKFNLQTITPQSDSVAIEHFNFLKALKEKGLEKLILSVWSPPLWMKHNQQRGNGSKDQYSAPDYSYNPDKSSNQLRREYFEEFAEYCLSYIRLIKEHTGFDVYAISLQNEPRFSQFFASTVYDPKALAELIEVVGSRFHRENLEIGIFAPEDVQNAESTIAYIQAIADLPNTLPFVKAFAIHNYRDDGINPLSPGVEKWQRTLSLASQYGKPLWMTETSGFDGSSFDDALSLAVSMHKALVYGNVSLWTYWQMSGERKDTLIQDGKKSTLFAISQHYFKHIRPGAIRVASDNTPKTLLVSAFIDANKLSVIMLNVDKNAFLVAPPKICNERTQKYWLSTKNQMHSLMNIDEQKTLNVPAMSISTLQCDLTPDAA